MKKVLGKRIVSIDENGVPKFKNLISKDKIVGEIQLQKDDNPELCNLCRNTIEDGLTEDHVPPKCMGNTGMFHFVNYANFINNKKIDYYGIAQGGIKYKTICSTCNNEVLTKYDNEISSLIKSYLENIETGKQEFEIICNPQLILKGIIGHFLAATLSSELSKFELEMLDYFWNDKKFTDNINFYVVPFHDENFISVIRELIFTSYADKSISTLNCLKSYPLSFFFIIDGYLSETENWNKWLFNSDDQTVIFDHSKCIDKWFPELHYPQNSGKLLGHNCAHSILGFREKEELPEEIYIQQ